MQKGRSAPSPPPFSHAGSMLYWEQRWYFAAVCRRTQKKVIREEKQTMEASNVYYTDFRCPVGTSLLEKLRRLCLAAGIRQLTWTASS